MRVCHQLTKRQPILHLSNLNQDAVPDEFPIMFLWKLDDQTESHLLCLITTVYHGTQLFFKCIRLLLSSRYLDLMTRLLIRQFFISACVNERTILARCRMAEHRSVSVRARHDPLSPPSEHLHNTSTSPRTDALWESRRRYNTARMHLRERWTKREKFLFLSFFWFFCFAWLQYCTRFVWCWQSSIVWEWAFLAKWSIQHQWTSILHQLPSVTILDKKSHWTISALITESNVTRVGWQMQTSIALTRPFTSVKSVHIHLLSAGIAV